MTSTTPAATIRATINRAAKVGLVPLLAFAIVGCASQAQVNQQSQIRFGNKIYVAAERISEKDGVGTKLTVGVGETMYQEVIGGLDGARISVPVQGESFGARYEAEAGRVFTRFDTDTTAVYCTPGDIAYNALSGWKSGCLIDTNKDGVFDKVSRLMGLYDYYDKGVAEADLDVPVPYETIRLEEPQFANQMWIRFQGKDGDASIYSFSTYGNILAGSDPEYTRLSRGNASRRALMPNSRVTVDGVTFTVIEVSDTSLTYRLEDTGFDIIQFTDRVVNGNTRRPFTN